MKTAAKEEKLVESWKGVPEGTDVVVRKDDGSEVETKTASGPFLLGGHTACIMLDGISGAYALERVKRMEEVRVSLGLDQFRELVRGRIVDAKIKGRVVKIALADIGWDAMADSINEARLDMESGKLR
jgi:hypothetical protein